LSETILLCVRPLGRSWIHSPAAGQKVLGLVPLPFFFFIPGFPPCPGTFVFAVFGGVYFCKTQFCTPGMLPLSKLAVPGSLFTGSTPCHSSGRFRPLLENSLRFPTTVYSDSHTPPENFFMTFLFTLPSLLRRLQFPLFCFFSQSAFVGGSPWGSVGFQRAFPPSVRRPPTSFFLIVSFQAFFGVYGTLARLRNP